MDPKVAHIPHLQEKKKSKVQFYLIDIKKFLLCDLVGLRVYTQGASDFGRCGGGSEGFGKGVGCILCDMYRSANSMANQLGEEGVSCQKFGYCSEWGSLPFGRV